MYGKQGLIQIEIMQKQINDKATYASAEQQVDGHQGSARWR